MSPPGLLFSTQDWNDDKELGSDWDYDDAICVICDNGDTDQVRCPTPS